MTEPSARVLRVRLGVGDVDGLVERDEDLARVRAASDAAWAGQGSLVFVRGPAGIGKSRMLGACAQFATSRGMRVLTARGRELERDFTFGVVRQLFEREVVAAADDVRARLLSGAAHHAGAILLGAGPLGEYNDRDSAAMHGLYWLAANLATQGVGMLVVDDAHWADSASLRFLDYLANRLDGLPQLVLVAARSDDPAAGDGLLRNLAATASTSLELEPLSASGCAQIVRERMPAGDAFVTACHHCSGGNPFLLDELLRAVEADAVAGDDLGAAAVRRLAPDSASRAVFLRLARLPDGTAPFARAVAVLGDRVELAHAAELAGLTLDQAAQVSDALAQAGVLERELPLAFAHPVILEAILSDLGPSERAAMHARAAELLHRYGADPEQIAAQLAASGPARQPWALDCLRRVASAAVAQGAPDVAQRHLQRALREELTPSDRAYVLAELGEAEALAGVDPAAAIDHLREAVDLIGEPARLAHTAIVLGRLLWHTGDAQGAADILVRILDTRSELARGDRLRLEAELGSIGLVTAVSLPHLRKRLHRFTNLAGDTIEELLMLGTVAGLAWHRGSAAEITAGARRALAGGRLLAAAGSDNFAFATALAALVSADELDEARVVCEAALADARARGSASGFALSCLFGAGIELRAGDVRECEAHARAALDAGGTDVLRPALRAHLALALTERGELDEAELTLAAVELGPHLPNATNMNFAFFARGLLRAAQGRDDEAVTDLCAFGERETLVKIGNPAFAWRVEAALACWRSGRTQQADRLLAEHDRAAARWGTAAAFANGIRGRAGAPHIDLDERIALLERATALFAQSTYRVEEARALCDLGVALRRTGKRRAAQRRLAESVALAQRCGATALALRANDELAVFSKRPRRLQFSGVDALTASERRIALMASDGQTNTQIAQALFVAPKTVETHLGHVFVKLAIKSRRELPAVLRETG
jgi:DNA-binding CsgD family transcriptional regulator